MSDEPEDLTLHLLREMREELRDTRSDIGKLTRRVDESIELMTQAMGLAALSNVRTDSFDDRIALVEDQVTAVRNQLRDLKRP